MLFQRAAGETEESGSFGRAQVTRRQAGVRIGHLRGSVIVWSAGADGGALAVTIAEQRPAKGDAEDEGVGFRYPVELLFLARWWPQQCAIAATHQGEAALNEANGPVAQVVGFPGAFGNLSGAKQDFRDFAVATAVHPPIERTKSERQPPATLSKIARE